MENRAQAVGVHEETLYGVRSVIVSCCISCCKVYALAHLDNRSKRPIQTWPQPCRPESTPYRPTITSYPEVVVALHRTSLSRCRI